MPGNTLVFVYGTLKNGQPNNYLLKDNISKYHCVYKGQATTVVTHPLVVAARYNIPYMLYKPGTGKHILGELYEVDADCLAVLDSLENHPKLYERCETKVRCVSVDGQDDSEVTACAYFLVKYRENLLELPFLDCYQDGQFGKYVGARAREVQAPLWWYEVHTDYSEP